MGWSTWTGVTIVALLTLAIVASAIFTTTLETISFAVPLTFVVTRERYDYRIGFQRTSPVLSWNGIKVKL